MIVSCNAALGSSPEACALTLTREEILELRDTLSASLQTVTRNEIESARRRAELMMRFNSVLNKAQ